MPTEWIAVVGSIDAGREQELALRDLDTSAATAKEIGRALAERDYGLIVYSGDSLFVESAIVGGYLESEKVKPGSIRVIFPRDRTAPAIPMFPKAKEKPECFKLEIDQNPHWESSFYRSLGESSGVLLVGGGRSTFVAGIVAKILHKPLLPIDAFGGAASEIWEMLDSNEDYITDDERRKLAIHGDATWALSVVDIMSASKKRRSDATNLKETHSRRSRNDLRYQAVSALVVFVLTIVLIVETWDNEGLSRVQLLSCLVASPLLAGFSGAFIRRIADIFQGKTSSPETTSAFILGVLGAIAGGFSGLLFLMPQLAATTASAADKLPVQLSRLVPFSMITGFLAGFTTDLVYEKLREAKAIGDTSVENLLKHR